MTERQIRVLLEALNGEQLLILVGALVGKIDDLQTSVLLEKFAREKAEEELATLKAKGESKDGENV